MLADSVVKKLTGFLFQKAAPNGELKFGEFQRRSVLDIEHHQSSQRNDGAGVE